MTPPPCLPHDHPRHTLTARQALGLMLTLAALLSGCASQAPEAPVAASTVATTPPPSPVAEEATTKAIPAPTEVQTQTIDPGGYTQRDDARQLADQLARDFGLDAAWVRSAMDQARYKDNVAKFIMPAPAGTAKNWAAYRSRFVEPVRIKAGVAFWRANEAELRRAEARWGVPASIIAGVIGVETIYGRQTGNFRLLDALTTLSLDFPKGRSDRSAFFQKELGHFLKLCSEQKMDPTSVLGSYAGAMGLPQFMPSSVRSFAIDFDGDGRVDLLSSPVDAIGSVARYLAEHGWERDMPIYYDVTPPADTASLLKLLAPDIVPSFTVTEMQDLGARLPDVAQNHTALLALVKLENGEGAPTLIAGTDNFYTITRYNQSSYYALAVIQLGQAVAREARYP
ncbi:MAG: lytic murein transglycosylase B [Rubrivivax sp.]|nr:MAG: lytic murein transglycosylase B [Rubrivivax sp.]